MCPHKNRLDEAILMSTHNIPFSIYKRKISLNYPKSAAVGFFQGTEERVRNRRGRRAISVRATEVLLYYLYWYPLNWILYLFSRTALVCRL